MQPGYGYGYGAPQGYAPAPGYGMPPQQPAYGYGVPGGGPPRPPRTENTAEDLDRIARTIHVGGIRGLRGTPGVNPGEEITEDDLAAFFGNDGEVVGVRINGTNCWIEFGEASGAMLSALAKDGTESGGHHLRISASKTPIRSNGYMKGRQIQIERAAARVQNMPSPAPTAAAVAPTVAGRQMTVDEIVHAIKVNVNDAVEHAKAQGTIVTNVPPPPPAGPAAAAPSGGTVGAPPAGAAVDGQ